MTTNIDNESDIVQNLSKNELRINHKSRRRQHVVKSFFEKANMSRTLVEKIADTLTARFGSVTFLVLNLIWFIFWIVVNTGFIPIMVPFDPFPFGLLTMIVSLEAIFLSVVVLISQNRASKAEELRGEVDLQINTIAEEEITKIIKLQVLLLKKNGVDVSKDPELQQMLEHIDEEQIEESLKKQL